MNRLSALALAASLMSCTSIPVSVENLDTNYTKYPIKVSQTLFSRSIALGRYSLVLVKNIAKTKNIDINLDGRTYKARTGGIYNFQKDGEKLYGVEIFQVSDISTYDALKTSTAYSTKYIQVEDNKAAVVDYKVLEEPGKDSYLEIANEHILFKKYYNQDTRYETPSKLQSGFSVTISDKEFGIVGLYQEPSLYILKTVGSSGEMLTVNMAMYTLAVFECFSFHFNSLNS